MSRVFSDGDLLSWEVYTSGGRFGLPDRPKIIFHCLSDPDRRSRWIQHEGDDASAAGELLQLDTDVLRGLLGRSRELD
ncbi:MAG: hypothetical protein WD766_00655 [Gemmatimonadota bacterium]